MKRRIIILLIVFCGIFCGGPKIQEAQAALPAVRAVGAVDAAIGAITPGMPAGVLTNDILLLFLETENEDKKRLCTIK